MQRRHILARWRFAVTGLAVAVLSSVAFPFPQDQPSTDPAFDAAIFKSPPTAYRGHAMWNFNLTTDMKREPWANFFETGPGLRFRISAMPSSLYLTVNYLRGTYTVPGDPYGPTFNDLRAGFWYALTH